MTTKKIPDPGKGLPKEQAAIARCNAWKRPTTKTARDMARADRVAAWDERYHKVVEKRRS